MATDHPSESSTSLQAEKLRAEIAQMESRFNSFIDSESESIFCYEPECPVPSSLPADEVAERFTQARLVVANRTFARLRGETDPSVFIGKSMQELAREGLARVAGLIKELVVSGNRQEGVEVQQRRPDGTVGTALSNGHLVLADGNYTRLWVILRDITAQKQLQAQHETLQQQLRQAQRMESLGLLAGGIAHDFNNLLLVIDNCARFVAHDLVESPEKAQASLHMIEEASARAARLIRSLMTFGRPHANANTVCAVDLIIADLMKTMRRLVPTRIELTIQLDSHASVPIEPSQLEQIVMNLVINATDAVEAIGTISIATRLAELTPIQKQIHPAINGTEFVEIVVSDSGGGIAPEVLPRIFEPYFTTKSEGKGNGLGLATVWTTAQSHGGFVEARSREEGHSGSQFRVFLPRQSESPVVAIIPVDRAAPTSTGKTILIVDDHEMVRNVTKTILERAGYRTITAADGEIALAIFADRKSEIDAVILDAVMPKMTGFQVYQTLRQQVATLPIIVVSGYTRDVFDPEWLAAAKPIILPKPFKPDELFRALESLFGGLQQRPT